MKIHLSKIKSKERTMTKIINVILSLTKDDIE